MGDEVLYAFTQTLRSAVKPTGDGVSATSPPSKTPLPTLGGHAPTNTHYDPRPRDLFKPISGEFQPPHTTPHTPAMSVKIRVVLRSRSTRPNGVSSAPGTGDIDCSNAACLPAPDASTQTSRAAAIAR